MTTLGTLAGRFGALLLVASPASAQSINIDLAENVRSRVRFDQGRDMDHATSLVACKLSSSSALRSSGSALQPLTRRN